MSYTPLRYPGGKAKIAPFIKKLLEKNKLLGSVYVEPYAGGAGLAIDLLINEYVERIVINDLNKHIYSFWYSVLYDCENLCILIRDTPVSIEERENQKKIYASSDSSCLELGFSLFYLNRTNRSGIISAGVIGGKNQTGRWKIDARYNKIDLIDRIKRISRYSDRIILHNLDATEIIATYSNNNNHFFYFDPPYYVKGGKLYYNHYDHDDHVRIKNLIKDSSLKRWIISYDDVLEIREIYSKYKNITYDLNYSASNARTGSEIMIFSDDLEIPNTTGLLRTSNAVSPQAKLLELT